MGVPVFREPVVEARTKADPTAAARSSIRRSREVRHPRGRPQPSAASDGRPYARRVSLLSDVARRDAGRSQLRLTPHELADQAIEAEAEADNARREVSDRRRMENGRALLRDALSYERPGRFMRQPLGQGDGGPDAPPPPLPPVEESSDYGRAPPVLPSMHSWDRFERENAHIEAIRAGLGPSAPTPPPYGDGDGHDHAAGASSGRGNRVGFAPYTPRFAPAYRFGEPPSVEADELVRRQLHDAPYDPVGHGHPFAPDPPTAGDLGELPPLRRVGHRTVARPGLAPAYLRAGRVDGLGDRQRSLSPDNTDAWETMVATVAPDAQLPSASSSFTSATASAATSRNSQPASTSTSLTAPSDGEYPAVCDDLLLTSDSDASDVDDDDDSESEGEMAGPLSYETAAAISRSLGLAPLDHHGGRRAPHGRADDDADAAEAAAEQAALAE
ncbi:MAG: hypothetical protein M1832_000001, partial [Thelocarpon impressellum]